MTQCAGLSRHVRCVLSLVPLLLALAESCSRRVPATMPPPSATTTIITSSGATAPDVRLPCTDDEKYYTSCINGACRAVQVWDGQKNVRSPFCDCDLDWEGVRCQLPFLPSTSAAGNANLAAGVVIGVLLVVSVLIGLVVFFKYRKRAHDDDSGESVETMVESPFCSAPTTYSRYEKKKVPGPCPCPQLNSVSSREDRVRLLPAIVPTVQSVATTHHTRHPPLARQETLSEVPEQYAGGNYTQRPDQYAQVPVKFTGGNNNAAPVHVDNSSIPTPLATDFAPFGINKDGSSSRRLATSTRV